MGVSVDSIISSPHCPAIGLWMAGLEIALSPFRKLDFGEYSVN